MSRLARCSYVQRSDKELKAHSFSGWEKSINPYCLPQTLASGNLNHSHIPILIASLYRGNILDEVYFGFCKEICCANGSKKPILIA